MGKKVNPKIFRMGITKSWASTWFESGTAYIKNVKQDVLVRKYLIKEFKEAGIDKVEIARGLNKIEVNLFTAKPGVLIGRGGNGAEELKKKIHDKFLKNFRLSEINLNIKEVSRPNLSAQILVQSMILDIEKRMPYRRVMKKAIEQVSQQKEAKGIKIKMSGRLDGAEISRREWLDWGKMPLQTLRADVDYAEAKAHCTYGIVGIKVWIYKGDIFATTNREAIKSE